MPELRVSRPRTCSRPSKYSRVPTRLDNGREEVSNVKWLLMSGAGICLKSRLNQEVGGGVWGGGREGGGGGVWGGGRAKVSESRMPKIRQWYCYTVDIVTQCNLRCSHRSIAFSHSRSAQCVQVWFLESFRPPAVLGEFRLIFQTLLLIIKRATLIWDSVFFRRETQKSLEKSLARD